ncbi:MAG: TlpA family protein disulfide reductase [Bacteroidales bacterium]|jgi:thiol-disulfide isomerase/thioredoxin|nr:TlpA family protein disulfide reductase [Bacteroidales bacterium]
MKQLFPLLFILIFTACGKTATSSAPAFKAVQYEELKAVLEQNDDVLYVVNFWATWCGPCVEELPGFMEVNAEYAENPKFKMILVSLDNVKKLDKTVKPFIASHKITTDVYLLDDNKRMNLWIPAFDASWSGSIPATVFYKNGKKLHFEENQLNKTELKNLIHQYL